MLMTNSPGVSIARTLSVFPDPGTIPPLLYFLVSPVFKNSICSSISAPTPCNLSRGFRFAFCSSSALIFSSLVPGASLVCFSSASTVSGNSLGIRAPAPNRTAPAANGFVATNFINPNAPLRILGTSPSNLGINPATRLIKLPINPPRPVKNNKPTASNAGQVFSKKPSIASTLSPFSDPHLISLTSSLPIKTFTKNSKSPSKKLLTGLTILFAAPKNFLRGLSNFSS